MQQSLFTLVYRPGEFGGVWVTEKARAAGIGVSLCETHPIDVTRLLLPNRNRGKQTGLFVYSYLQHCFKATSTNDNIIKHIVSICLFSLCGFLWRC